MLGSASAGVGEEEHFSGQYVWQALKDWQVWLQILVYFCIVAPCELPYSCPLSLETLIGLYNSIWDRSILAVRPTPPLMKMP